KLSSIAVAKAMTSQNNPIAFQLRLIVKNKNIIISNSGIIIPAPEPQRIRPTIKTEKLGAKAEINVPRANMLMAVKNNFLVVNFLMRNAVIDRKSTRLNSSHVSISYAVFCLKKKTKQYKQNKKNKNLQKI